MGGNFVLVPLDLLSNVGSRSELIKQKAIWQQKGINTVNDLVRVDLMTKESVKMPAK